MAFKESNRMEERVGMLREFDTGVFSVAGLCARYGISRETFYVWKRRRDAGFADWFVDRSHAPGHCPHSMAPEVAAALLALRRKFVHFGPKKLRARLLRDAPEMPCPSASSIGLLLQKNGLVAPVARRRQRREQAPVIDVASAPNEEWSIDFKGHFHCADGTRCDPLTVTDTASRYLLTVELAAVHGAAVQEVLTRLFFDHGLPLFLRSDNGPPFGSSGAGGLSTLSVWLLKMGVEPRFIPPSSPQDNGRHERLHRTLKALTSAPPAANPAAQQQRFDAFRARYNQERPHEAIHFQTPAECWQPSPRPLNFKPQEPCYAAEHAVQRVGEDGTIRFRGHALRIGKAFAGEWIGLAEQENGAQLVRFMHREIGAISHRGEFQPFAPPRAKLRSNTPPDTPSAVDKPKL